MDVIFLLRLQQLIYDAPIIELIDIFSGLKMTVAVDFFFAEWIDNFVEVFLSAPQNSLMS